MLTILVAFVAIIVVAVYLESKKKVPGKILGIYTQPGKWYLIKYVSFLTFLKLRQLKSRYLQNVRTEKIVGATVENLESLQPLSSHEKAVDAVFFQAVSQDGYTICGGLERRHQGKANGLVYLVVPGIGLLSSEKLPSTLLDADSIALQNNKEYAAGGISLTPVEPMKKWRISFEGNMKIENSDNKKIYAVTLEADWTSSLPYFFYETDLSCRALARSIARETWSKEFFDRLKSVHQSHYEQVGKLMGKLIIDGKEHPLNMAAFRDHSFAYKRDWSLMHRYIFNMFYLENGLFVIVGVISQPCTTTSLEVGYVLNDNEIDAIEFCNLQLYQHAENGRPPKNYGFTFVANGITYDANVYVEHEAYHFKGKDDEAKLFERFIRVDVNGIRGRGISEWHYNNNMLNELKNF